MSCQISVELCSDQYRASLVLLVEFRVAVYLVYVPCCVHDSVMCT